MSSLQPVGIPTTVEQDARQLITDIRVKHSTVAHKELAQIVTSLLYLTSSELYDRSTHCILELLQNADDNRYEDNVIPTLTFTFEPGSLRVDCNERGFEARHVEAISTVRHSTKTGKKRSHDYTGEKGIGFKSVYRIADEVWISSRQYSFKFDKHREFGMIAPVWAKFPRPVRPHLTSFFLKLAEGYDQNELIKELKNFDSSLLLFLRRIRKIEFRVQEGDGSEWSQVLQKTTESDQKYTITILHSADTQQRCVTFDSSVVDLPFEPRRPYISSSALTFALPIDTLPDESLHGCHQVFALLPISDYGLKFSLNGDFILSASRSNIDESLSWNQKLRDGLADGFLAAVDYFNGGRLKYIWPYYIPDNNVSTFFSPARELITTRLKSEKILESSASCMAQPSSLVYVVPNKYTDSSGRPFTLCSETAKSYLSDRYPKRSIGSMLALGVIEMNDASFLEDLETMIRTDATFFQEKSEIWHQELSKALLPLTQKDKQKDELMKLPIIPLCDGTWTSAQHQPVFFANDLDPRKFPNNIELLIIDPTAYNDYNRKTLLQALEITEINSTRLCKLIAVAHASDSFCPEKLSRVELISHVAYLFKSSWQPVDGRKVDLWFATSDGGRCKGSQTYIRGECEADSILAKIFDKLRKRFSSVHDNYFLGPSSNDAVRLADSLDIPFATFSRSRPGDPTTAFANRVDGDDWTQFLADLSGHKNTELIFDIDDVTFAGDGHRGGPILLTKSCTSSDQFSHAAPVAPTIHDSYHSISIRDLVLKLEVTASDKHTSFDAEPQSSSMELLRQYLIKTLQLAEIPRLVSRHDGNSKGRFYLSKEFRFLFNECLVTDVLQLLHEHWTTYSEWLELSAAQQHSIRAVRSNQYLLEEIGAIKAKTRKGSVAIRDIVLPNLDTYVDSLHIPVHVLDIANHEDPTLRRRLASFGMAVTNDSHYYLVCLQALSNQAFPDHDTLTYLYEQIQLRFSNDEDAVCSAFEEAALIFIGQSVTQGYKRSWLTTKEAKERRKEVFRLYPDCGDFYAWLLNTTKDDLNELVAEATTIDTLWSVYDISTLLIRISGLLVSKSATKTRLALKPLRSCAIFPVRGPLQRKAFDLMTVENRNWFIADRSELGHSFRGVAPLLAFTAIELQSMRWLLNAMGLTSRKLSMLCRKTIFPSGEIRYSVRDTEFFRIRSKRFIMDLIPRELADRDRIRLQLANAVVMVAAKILESEVFRYNDGPEYIGHPREVNFVLREQSERKELRIYIARKNLICKGRFLPLIDSVAEHCGIENHTSWRLLDSALRSSHINRVHDVFHAAGYAGHDRRKGQDAESGIDSDTEGDTDSDTDSDIHSNTDSQPRRRKARRGAILRIPSIFSDPETESDSEENTARASYKSGKSYRSEARKRRTKREKVDPRLPVLSFRQVGFETPLNPINAQGKFLVTETLDPGRHLEYYGERLVSEMFEIEFGDAYIPGLHWTSSLRIRAGIPLSTDGSDPSPFTFADARAVKEMSLFLQRRGRFVDSFWKFPHPTFHVEIAVSPRDGNDPFVWSTAQLKRTQKHQIQQNGKTVNKDIVVLLKISNVYSEPTLEVFLNPWELVISKRLVIHGNTKFRATLERPKPPGGSFGRDATLRSELRATPGFQTQMEPCLSAIAPNRSSYKYSVLSQGEFWLFLLFPGEQSEPIRGMLFTVSSIQDAGNFRTLSYEWGKKRKERQILTESGMLKIWESLYDAILNLRDETSAAVLWADAICINQSDDEEKIHQIRLLPQIFQHASQTIAFLGSDRNSDDAIETLLQIRAKLDGPRTWPKGLKHIPHYWTNEPKPYPKDPIWQDIKHFFDRTWFRRAWIVQEAVAAPTVTVFCGKWVVDWEDIHSAMEVVQREPQLPDDVVASWGPFLTLSSLRDSEARQRRFDLLTLLNTFQYLDSTLKRDHFFALLGLAADGNEEAFAPQYGSSDFASIACRYGRAFVKQGKGVHLLRQAGIAGRSVLAQDRFPSWLPDFTTKPTNRLLDAHNRDVIFNASEGVEEDITCPNSTSLCVSGCMVDEIVEVSKHSNGQGPKQWIKYFAEIDDMLQALYGKTQPEHAHHLKVHVPIAGAISVGNLTIEDSYAAFSQGLKKARFKSAKHLRLRNSKVSATNIPGTMHRGAMTMQDKSKLYESLLKKNIEGWRFIVTKRKYCGIAPNGVQVGDIVSVIGGGDVPFILREVASHKTFRLIAGCYIHGMMNGEAPKFSDVEDTYFLIE